MSDDAFLKGRKRASSGDALVFDPFEFDAAAGILYQGEQETLLPPKAAAVLEVLVARAGQLVGKDELLGAVWADTHVTERVLTDAVSLLRHVLGDDAREPIYIQTLHRRGYRFIAEVRSREEDGASRQAGGLAVSEACAPRPPVASATSQQLHLGALVAGARAVSPQGELAAASRLGKYEILGLLGAGAMGRVYRARDTVLEREVAVKVLPEEFAADPERLARLEHEAKLLASVSHANIAAIYSLEEADGAKFPVLELIEGQTLEERLRSGRMEVQEALEVARQIASACEAAHERGIVHRDLKPANIKLTPSGQVKVLDFGLARALKVKVFGEGSADSPAESITIRGGHRGAIVGTAAYMSPEQARGQEADKRADIWSFGCVFYEMLTGQRAFRRDTVAETLVAILDREPDWERLPAATPVAIRRLLRRCLNKSPQNRLHDIADARIEIEETIAEPPELSGPADPRGATLPSSSAAAAGLPIAWMAAWIAAALVVGAIAGVILAPGPGAPTRPETSRFVITDEDGDHDQLVVTAGQGIDLRLTPDGSELVYLGLRGGTRRLYRRPLGSFVGTALRGTDGAYQPFFSPDGRSLGFFAQRTLMRMQFPEGAPLGVIELATNPAGATWLADDTIVVGMRQTGLVRIAVSTGAAETLTVPDPQRGETAHNWPEALPGGAGVLFTALRGPELVNARIAVWSADAADWRIVLDEEGYNARYVTSGHLIYGRSSVLWAVPFDAERLKVTGKPVQVLDDPVVTKSQGAQAFAVSSNGPLAFVPYVPTDRELVWMDREGTSIEPVGAPDHWYAAPDLSPDGERIVVGVDYRVRMYDIENGSLAVLPAAGSSSGLMPSWSADGSTIAFIGGGGKLYTAPADGSGSADLVWESPFLIWGPKWSPDGEFILVNTLAAESASDVWRVSLDDGQPAPYLHASDSTGWPAFSPSGRWVAYSSTDSDRAEIYAVPFPDSAAGRVVISAGGGTKPLWFDDEVFYRNGARVWSVRIEETATDLRILSREQLPVVLPYEGGGRYDYDYDPVNGRFLVVRPVGENPGSRIHVVVDWLAEISALMSARR